jgi:PilZ domain
MEGSSTRTFPRMLMDKPVELQIGDDTIRVENPMNNLSIGGMFVNREDLPVGAPVRIRIPVNHHFFEADGQIRNSDAKLSGVGIGFTSLSNVNRQALNELIEELTLRGLPAA